MEFPSPLCLFFVLFITLLSTSQASKYYVGGSAGWTPNPSENYNQWSGRNRFLVNDTLVFKYTKGSDSVLEVKKEDYDNCNKTNPLKKFDDGGQTEVMLDRPGPFYFISGQDGNCESKSQKLAVVVITPRSNKPTVPATPPSPPGNSPSASPPSPPGNSPSASPPSPVSPSPAVSPLPAGKSPASSPTPAAKSPSPSPAISTPPASSPAPSATSPSPTSISPAGGPPAPSPISASPAGGPSSAPGAETPGSANSPASSDASAPPPKSSATSVIPSRFLVLSVIVVVGAVFFHY